MPNILLVGFDLVVQFACTPIVLNFKKSVTWPMASLRGSLLLTRFRSIRAVRKRFEEVKARLMEEMTGRYPWAESFGARLSDTDRSDGDESVCWDDEAGGEEEKRAWSRRLRRP